MKRTATQSNGKISSTGSSTRKHGPQFTRLAAPGKKLPAGISKRGERYYGQLWVECEDGTKTARRFPLEFEPGVPASNVTQAKEAFDILKSQRRDKKLPTQGRKPTVAAFIETYFQDADVLSKKPGTIKNERQALARWKKHIGDTRIDRVKTAQIAAFKNQRIKTKEVDGEKRITNKRTVNLDLIALRNLFAVAETHDHVKEQTLPKIEALKNVPKPDAKNCMHPGDFERLLAGVKSACEKNAQQFTDYLKFLAFTGARMKEAMKVRWSNINLDKGIVTIGARNEAKNWLPREIQCIPQLSALLRDMEARRQPDCDWLFPSPQRGKKDIHVQSFRESLRLARKAAGLPKLGFHDIRHTFASVCLMSGLPVPTVAQWLGHKDGGKLLLSTYSHLLRGHEKEMAARVTIGLSAAGAQ